MLEKLYNLIDRKEETASVIAFLSEYVKGNADEEELFFDAVRDTHYAGFRDGVRAVINLLREAS